MWRRPAIDVTRPVHGGPNGDAHGGADRPVDQPVERAGGMARFGTFIRVVSPLTVATVLLFYFGWVRTRVEAAALGYDSKILDFSTADYVLRSVNVLSIPLVAVLILSLALYRLHQWLAASLAAGARARLATILLRSWLLWLVACVFLLLFVPPMVPFAIPGALTLGLLLAVYGDNLRRGAGARGEWTRITTAIVLVLLAFTVIWDTERLARAMGEGYAASIAADPGQLAAVVIYSPKGLELSLPHVTETRIGGPESAYRFRYVGLRLLQRSGDKYILINDGWNRADGRVVVIRDSDDIRLEFRR